MAGDVDVALVRCVLLGWGDWLSTEGLFSCPAPVPTGTTDDVAAAAATGSEGDEEDCDNGDAAAAIAAPAPPPPPAAAAARVPSLVPLADGYGRGGCQSERGGEADAKSGFSSVEDAELGTDICRCTGLSMVDLQRFSAGCFVCDARVRKGGYIYT